MSTITRFALRANNAANGNCGAGLDERAPIRIVRPDTDRQVNADGALGDVIG